MLLVLRQGFDTAFFVLLYFLECYMQYIILFLVLMTVLIYDNFNNGFVGESLRILLPTYNICKYNL